jgi:hypothetical protein
LENSGGVGRQRPLDAEADDEAAAADIDVEPVRSLLQPCTNFGRGGGDRDVNAAVEEEVS